MKHSGLYRFHTLHFAHCKIIYNPYSTNKLTVPLVLISLLIRCYVFRLKCHHQGADTLLKLTTIKECYNVEACPMYRLYSYNKSQPGAQLLIFV